MRIALIDADVVAFASAAVVEKAINWDDGIWTLHADETEGRVAFSNYVHRVAEATEAESVVLAFSDKKNFRSNILPTYKHNRKDKRPPLLRRALVDWALEEYDCVVRNGLEGDDVMGILATRRARDGFIICTIDKDLKTIPGAHYNMGRGTHFTVTEEEADRYHMYQTLTGDPTDGYDGLPGCGPVAAERILSSATDGDLWGAVVRAYEKKGLCEEEALTQARVARILRAEDYDFEKKQPILWTPNK